MTILPGGMGRQFQVSCRLTAGLPFFFDDMCQNPDQPAVQGLNSPLIED
ncbi:MAG: hypothetical protein RLZZ413_3510 [Pseudomonadota bacterium]|jgi:hypothetical protein